MKRLEIEYTLTQRETNSFLRGLYIKGFFDLEFILKAFAVLLVITLYLILTETNVFLPIYIILLATALVFFTYRLLTSWSWADWFKERDYSISDEHTYLLTDEGITRTYGDREVIEKWEDMAGYCVTRKFYQVKGTQVEGFIIPRSAVKNDEEHQFIIQCFSRINSKKAVS